MSDLIYKDGILIDASDIIEYPVVNESLSFDSSITIPDTAEFTLNDTEGKYNPDSAGSVFSDGGYYSTIEIFSEDLNRYTFRGLVTNISSSNMRVSVTATSNLSEIADSPCKLNANRITPAEAIYRILTNVPATVSSDNIILSHPKKYPVGTVPVDQVVKQSFDDAARYQAANRLTVDIAVDDSEADNNTTTCGEIIGKLMEFGHCSIYTHGNLIYLYQWKESTTGTNYPIYEKDIKASTISCHYAQDEAYKIRNQYRIAYKSNDSTLWATGQNDESIKRYKYGKFCIPDEDVQSSDSQDYTLIFSNYAGARRCGEIAMSRFSTPTKIFGFETPKVMDFLRVGSLVTMQISPYTGLNCIITEKNKTSQSIEFSCVVLK